MQLQEHRTALLPSVVVLRRLCADHAGDPPREAVEQAGFDHSQVAGYFKRCAAASAPASAA